MKARTDLQLKLNQALHSLRDDVETAVQHYGLRTQAALAAMIARLDETQASAPKLPARAIKSALARLARLTLKPKKGRAKDLKRIESLIEKLGASFDHPA
jgi:hypothetical protein